LRELIGQTAVALSAANEFEASWREDVTLGEDLRGTLAQRVVVDQLQRQKRREHTKRVSLERRLVDRPESCRMHWNAGHRQVVVADRAHAHDREQAAHERELIGASKTDGAVTLHVQAIELTGLTKAVAKPPALEQPAEIANLR
jgi:hypothetical protein